MANNMYMADEICLSNEELVCKIQNGDTTFEKYLLSKNEGFITKTATNILRNRNLHYLLEDLKQEGGMALLKSAKTFNSELGTKFLTYGATAIRSSMLDFLAKNMTAHSVSPSRFIQLRQVNFIKSNDTLSFEQLVEKVSGKLNVTAKVAIDLIAETESLFSSVLLGDDVFNISSGGDPAISYARKMKHEHLHQLLDTVLSPREKNVVLKYCGLDDPNDKGMTFENMAVYLNFTSASATEKAFKKSIAKLKTALIENSCLWSMAEKQIQSAQNDCAIPHTYSSPKTTWYLEDIKTVELFPKLVYALVVVFCILHEAIEKNEEENKG